MSPVLERNSDIITPMSYLIDLLVINMFAYFLPINFESPLLFHGYISVAWIVISVQVRFYEIPPYTKVTNVLLKLVYQSVFFFLILYAYIGLFKQPNISRLALGQYLLSVCIAIFVLKFIIYILLMEYRERFEGNSRRVVVVGDNNKTEHLINVFVNRKVYGYRFVKQFCPEKETFDLGDCFRFIVFNQIDEIYCSVSELSNTQITEFINFADNNLKTLKFLPDNKNIYTKKLRYEYYDYLPILSLRDIPLHKPLNALFKRTFDIVFSLFVIFGLLIWIGPILAILISLESKGPLFFIQKRSGLDNRAFNCYKFRSMAMNKDADKQQASKNDMRITKIGKFIRKTSIDELPQFYNVLFGNMSVVGPRPHMLKHTDEYASKVDKYMLRHFVKPGITGLAQVKGYRGEIQKESDILNRIKLDIFYIENWSFLLDLKIIVQTILNVFKGEDKAY